MNLELQQALEILLSNGITVSVNGEINTFISTIFSTMIGAVLGGMITLRVNRKFELERLRINNVIEMHRKISPKIDGCQHALGLVNLYLNNSEGDCEDNEGEEEEEDRLQHEIAKKAVADAIFALNTEINNYEIELSMFLKEYERILGEFLKFKTIFENYDKKNWTIQEFLSINLGYNSLVDKLATLSEDIPGLLMNWHI